jgi:predicted MPP superfamily phosphohydrolase
MSPFWGRVTFITVALALLFGAHRYAWARFARDVQFSRAWKVGAGIVIALLGLSIPTAVFLSRRSIGEGELNLALVAYLWLGFLFYGVLWLWALDLGRLSAMLVSKLRANSVARTEEPSSVAQREQPVSVARREQPAIDHELPSNPDRRVFIARAIAGTAAVGSGAIVVGGYHAALGEITTPEIPVQLARLPRELSGYRIVQLTDLHLGPTLATRFLESVVEKANAQKPDLVAITGDLVDGHAATLGPALAPLAKLSARHGVVFVTGNHEYYSGAEEWVEFLRKRGIRVLMNERVEIGDTLVEVPAGGGDEIWRAATAIGSRRTPRASFDLAGIPDLHGGSYSPEHRPDLERALAGRDASRELVLLAHQPAQIAMAENCGVGLQISGHTHGGQMWPFGALVALVQPYVAGFHRHPDGTQIYVSRGTGFWGPPMRVCNPAEVTSLVLVAS